jgi:hypothetical protein
MSIENLEAQKVQLSVKPPIIDTHPGVDVRELEEAFALPSTESGLQPTAIEFDEVAAYYEWLKTERAKARAIEMTKYPPKHGDVVPGQRALIIDRPWLERVFADLKGKSNAP